MNSLISTFLIVSPFKVTFGANFEADEVPNPAPPQSPQEKLTKFFENRPSQQELEERNILKDIKVAPAIQSAKVFFYDVGLGIYYRRNWRKRDWRMIFPRNSPIDRILNR